MNHNGVTLECRQCERPSAVILDGVYYCSSHALAVTVERLGSHGLVVDLRDREPLVGLARENAASQSDPRAAVIAV